MRESRGGAMRVELFAALTLSLLVLLLPCVSAALTTKTEVPARLPLETTPETKISGELVMLTVTVTDKDNRPVPNLTHQMFTVYDNKQPQEIQFFLAQEVPASIGILLDMSNSVSGRGKEMLGAVRENLSRFIKQGDPKNEYFLMTFNQTSELLVDWTSDGNAMVGALDHLMSQRGYTAFYDACYLGIEKMKRARNGKRALILLTDGQDNASRHQLDDLRALLKLSGTTIYSIDYLNRALPASLLAGDRLASEGQNLLRALASPTGGESYFPGNANEYKAVFDRLAAELCQQYLMGYYPPGKKGDGRWHKIKVELKPAKSIDGATLAALPDMSKLKVRTRAGYYDNRISVAPVSDPSAHTLAGIVYFTNNTPPDLDQFPVELFTIDKQKRVAATTLDAHGRFGLTGIKPGEYLVKFTWLPDQCTLWYRADLREASKPSAKVIMDAACGHPHPLSDLPEN